MSFAQEIVASIEAKIKSPEFKVEMSGDILKDCTRAIRNLNKRHKRAKSVSEKSHLTACLGQVKGLQHMLKDKKVGCGSGVRRAETATHRVKWEDVNSAFDSRIRTGVIINVRHTEVILFLEDCAALFKRRIRNALKKDEALKVNAVLCGEFQINKADKVVEELKYLNTRNAAIYRDTDLQTWFKTKIIDPLLAELEDFQERDSGWALSRVVNLMVGINKYNPLHAGSYIELPKQIARKEACINVKNTDDMCFAWAVVSALYPAPFKVANRTSSYPYPKTVLNLEGIQFPMTVGQYKRFEKQNNLSFNVYRLDKIKENKFQVLPYRITQMKQDKHVNLLLLQDSYIQEDELDDLAPVKYHYIWIKNLSRLISSQLSKRDGGKFICDRCLHYFRTQEKLDLHSPECIRINDCVVPRLPQESQATVKFTNYRYKEKVPFIIYADTECLLVPVEDSPTNNTQKYQQHIPFSVGYYVKCSHDESLSFYRSYTGPDCMQWFVKELVAFAENVETVFLCPLPMERLTQEENLNFHNAVDCHICERHFNTENDKKVRDHDHLTGKYRGPAHECCNLNFTDSHTVPVVFHNLSSYDGHLVIKALAETEGRIDVLPVNKEKYIAFTKHIPNNLVQFRFIDSFRFMASGLDSSASYLGDYPNLKSEFGEISSKQFELITRKGVFPYDHMDGWEKLNEAMLPPRHAFYNNLLDCHVSKKEYTHAQMVWESFNCRTLRDYSELYLKTDVLLLADVFEAFRSTSHRTYGLDPAHSYTLPGYAWQCMLYKTMQTLELFTDMEMVLFMEKGIRGGLSQCSKRYAEANNKYMPNYDPTQPSKYLMYFDINNQYGWAMSQYLPFGGFKWMTEDDVKFFDVSYVQDDSEMGYILEVDLEIPHELHDKFADLPPCPEHRKPGGSKNTKLLATLYNKEKYVIHYRNLKQALSLGVKLLKIHRALSFNQSPWLKQYIDLNTQLRQNAKNDFEKNLFKLMNNAVFGKTMENIRNHSNVKLVTNWNGRYGAEALISRPEFKSVTIINEHLIIIEMGKSAVYFNKPIYVGMCILDLAKTTIYNFHYNYMCKNFSNCIVCYTDTDSLIFEITHDDVYQIMNRDCYDNFDTSDYASDNIYNIPRVNKKILGMMKDENNGRIMTHFAGLRSKMYTVKTLFTPEELEKERLKLEKAAKERAEIDCALSNLGVTKKIKGIKKCVIKNKITFEDYVYCLETWLEKPISQRTIRSTKHDLYSIRQTKIGLSPYDDKRKISKSSPDTLPWGHFTIMEEV